MKNSLALFCFAVIFSSALHAQIKTNKLGNKTAINLDSGIKVPSIKNLSTADLSKLNLPTIAISDIQKNAKALSKWSINPMRLKDTYLEVSDFFGYGTKNTWEIHSMPQIEGREVTKWNSGFLWLKFRQSLNITYRIKIKLKGNNYRGREIYMSVDGYSAKYPINPHDGTVNTVWTASRTNSNSSIAIGQLLGQSPNHDQRQPYEVTKIEYVLIERISN